MGAGALLRESAGIAEAVVGAGAERSAILKNGLGAHGGGGSKGVQGFKGGVVYDEGKKGHGA